MDEELIREDEFKGTRKFGMVLRTGQGKINAVGTLLHIDSVQRLDDGRMLLNCKGLERISVKDADIGSDNVVYGDCVSFPDLPDFAPEEEETLEQLAEQVKERMRIIIKKGSEWAQAQNDSEDKGGEDGSQDQATRLLSDLESMTPTQLSFWTAGFFSSDATSESTRIDQRLLEMPTARQRLKQEIEVLRQPVDFITAQETLKDLGQEDSNEEER